MQPESDEDLLRRLQELQIEFDAGTADGERVKELLVDTMYIQRRLRERGVSDVRIAEAIAAVVKIKGP